MALTERLIDRLLAKLVKRGSVQLTHASGRIERFGAPAAGLPPIALRFADDQVARDILLDPALGLGEAFMDGRVLIEEGDILEFVSLLRASNPFEQQLQMVEPSLPRKLSNRLITAAHAINRPGSSRKNVSHHYDIGNDLYRLMLDPEHMQYSCAYWPGGVSNPATTLAQAQKAKLAHIAAKLNLEPGLSVLDIGCGWGGMAIFLAQAAGVRVRGITLSTEQLALARERAEAAGVADKVTFELIDYRELARRGDRFDRIVSVGMFEHVGAPQFETFFRACATMLHPAGCMLLHTIGRMGPPGRTDAFTDKWIFPGGYIPALSETLAASEKVRLIASDVENLRMHYGRTIREWYANCLARKAEIEALMGERFYRLWTYYLAGAATNFEHGSMCNYQIQYIRDRRALPVTRDYMARAEARLLEG